MVLFRYIDVSQTEIHKSMKVPFLDLRITDKQEKKNLLKAVNNVFTHGRIVLGPEVELLEKKIADYCSRRFAVGVNSGTDALIVGLKSIGIAPGDEVITTSLSWVATANAIAILGATPVFADISDDLTIDPTSVERLVTSKTKAILPVHYTGKICQMDYLQNIADKHSIPIVEDAAQSFGAKYKNRIAGSFGKIACFSTNPMKVFAAVGEAGFVVTDDREIRDRLVSLRYNGTINKETCIAVSLNARLDTVQAAILLERLPRVNKIIQKRRANASYYYKNLKDVSGIILLPTETGRHRNVYYTYQIRVKNRDGLKMYLEKKGVETKIQHQCLIPNQPIFKTYPRDQLTNAEKIVQEILCIPIHEKLSAKERTYVAACIREFYD